MTDTKKSERAESVVEDSSIGADVQFVSTPGRMYFVKIEVGAVKMRPPDGSAPAGIKLWEQGEITLTFGEEGGPVQATYEVNGLTGCYWSAREVGIRVLLDDNAAESIQEAIYKHGIACHLNDRTNGFQHGIEEKFERKIEHR